MPGLLPLDPLRSRSHWCAGAAVLALLAAALLGLAPQAAATLGQGPWPPLHARCVAAMALSLGVALLLARRTFDPAALRLPLLALAAWALASALLLLLRGASVSWPPLGLGALGALAWRLARIDGDPPAPAQHADRLLLGWAGLGGALALGLVLAPARAAQHWPWPLGAGWVVHYAPLFAAWALAAALAARERRRYVRTPLLWGLFAWALATLAASWWHRAALRWAEPAAWGWIVGLTGVALTAAQRLGRRRWLGPWSRDSGTGAPRQ
jgi:hypothetical protein